MPMLEFNPLAGAQLRKLHKALYDYHTRLFSDAPLTVIMH